MRKWYMDILTQDLAKEREKLYAREQWHQWFAWKPVRLIDGRWAYLRWIERRLIGMHDIFIPEDLWEYRKYQFTPKEN